MAAEPPAPRCLAARLAEDPHVVHPRVAATLAVEGRGEALGLVEHVLEPHRGRDRHVAGGGEAAGDQAHRAALLARTLLVDGQPSVVGGGVEPASSLGVVVPRPGCRATCDRLLVVVEGPEPGEGGLGHPVGHLTGRVRGALPSYVHVGILPAPTGEHGAPRVSIRDTGRLVRAASGA